MTVPHQHRVLVADDDPGISTLVADLLRDEGMEVLEASDGAEAIQVIPTGRNAHSILPDRSNKFVYAATLGANQVLQFTFDGKTGKLTPNEPAAVSPGAGHGPRHMTFSPDNKNLYVLNELSGHVTQFAVDSGKGTLTLVQNAPTQGSMKPSTRTSCAPTPPTPAAHPPPCHSTPPAPAPAPPHPAPQPAANAPPDQPPPPPAPPRTGPR